MRQRRATGATTFAVSLLAAAAAVLVAAGPATAATAALSRWRWPAGTANVVILNQVAADPRWEQRLRRVASLYQGRIRLTPILESGRRGQCQAPEVPDRGVIVICFGPVPEGTAGQAISYVDTVTGEVFSVAINLRPWQPGSVSEDFWYDYVLCHELGHAFGLPHSTSPRSCMSSAWRRALPDDHDFSILAALEELVELRERPA